MKRVVIFFLLVVFLSCTGERRSDPSVAVSVQTSGPDSSTHAAPLVSTELPNQKFFFPVYGITLGVTTADEIQAMGYKCTSGFCDVNVLSFYDNDNDNIVDNAYTTDALPDAWIEKFQFSFEKSYDDWIDLLKSNGFTVTVNKAPVVVEYENRNTLSAEVEASYAAESILLLLTFDYGNADEDGFDTSSPRSLYSLSVAHYDPAEFDAGEEEEEFGDYYEVEFPPYADSVDNEQQNPN